jgi:GntR family transcriptional regulator, gluconate operon transcriptional repressor
MLSEFTPSTARRADLWEIVVASLRRAIIIGELAPGLHLQEPLLAQKFGVSRVPVREALIRLEHEGLVRSEPRRGAFVVGMTLTQIREVYDMRRLLEVHAARLAAERTTPADGERLQGWVDAMARALHQGQTDALAEADSGLHRETIIVAGHRRLLAAWEPLAGVITTLLTLTNKLSRDKDTIIPLHQALVDALVRHDPDAAEAITGPLLNNGEQLVLDLWPNLAIE